MERVKNVKIYLWLFFKVQRLLCLLGKTLNELHPVDNFFILKFIFCMKGETTLTFLILMDKCFLSYLKLLEIEVWTICIYPIFILISSNFTHLILPLFSVLYFQFSLQNFYCNTIFKCLYKINGFSWSTFLVPV